MESTRNQTEKCRSKQSQDHDEDFLPDDRVFVDRPVMSESPLHPSVSPPFWVVLLFTQLTCSSGRFFTRDDEKRGITSHGQTDSVYVVKSTDLRSLGLTG